MPQSTFSANDLIDQHKNAEEIGLRARDSTVTNVEAVVRALIPEFELVEVQTADGRSLSITGKTKGVSWQSLHEGQRLSCQVKGVLTPRIIRASLLA